ncbi:MAG: preprotein translocase subunit SecG [Alphaproteobacteria bacterium]|nr:preprotein translocase subunit SecG [Alphaproteobacteria bacterium]
MATVILVIHLMIAAAMIGVVLMQKSEGGALGIGGSGGGGGGGGFLTGRGQANLLTRVTAGLAMAFFATSIALTILGQRSGSGDESIFDRTTAPAAVEKTTTPSKEAPAKADDEPSGGILDKLK